MKKCDVCGHEIQKGLESRHISFAGRTESGHPEIARIKEVFGQLEFTICLVCELKALGIKEKSQ